MVNNGTAWPTVSATCILVTLPKFRTQTFDLHTFDMETVTNLHSMLWIIAKA